MAERTAQAGCVSSERHFSNIARACIHRLRFLLCVAFSGSHTGEGKGDDRFTDERLPHFSCETERPLRAGLGHGLIPHMPIIRRPEEFSHGPPSNVQIAQEAGRRGLELHPLSARFLSPTGRQIGLVLDDAAYNEEEIRAAVHTLAEIVSRFKE